MHGIGHHIVTALIVQPEPYEPDDDLRTLRAAVAPAKAHRRTWRSRRRYRFDTQSTGWVRISTIRS